ncbi:hypothetical protein WA026_011793 [Henosepilachna vigintioctopunctata]|uniref:Uncharacterized protein n=1 Tax=Henosepilachna vigintioctopunctata TaxID=420089 RepID=A0AAW1UA16_9CUCU
MSDVTNNSLSEENGPNRKEPGNRIIQGIRLYLRDLNLKRKEDDAQGGDKDISTDIESSQEVKNYEEEEKNDTDASENNAHVEC